jgi:hypothetical protein
MVTVVGEARAKAYRFVGSKDRHTPLGAVLERLPTSDSPTVIAPGGVTVANCTESVYGPVPVPEKEVASTKYRPGNSVRVIWEFKLLAKSSFVAIKALLEFNRQRNVSNAEEERATVRVAEDTRSIT